MENTLSAVFKVVWQIQCLIFHGKQPCELHGIFQHMQLIHRSLQFTGFRYYWHFDIIKFLLNFKLMNYQNHIRFWGLITFVWRICLLISAMESYILHNKSFNLSVKYKLIAYCIEKPRFCFSCHFSQRQSDQLIFIWRVSFNDFYRMTFLSTIAKLND